MHELTISLTKKKPIYYNRIVINKIICYLKLTLKKINKNLGLWQRISVTLISDVHL